MAYKGNSIVDYLNSVGQDSSFSARKKLAQQNGISNYTGTASQNLSLLNTLRSGSGGATKENTSTATNTAKTNTTTNQNTANTGTQNNTANTTATAPLKGISQDTYDAMNKQFETSDLYNQAMATVNQQLAQINTGKTSYTDQIAQLITDFQNRDKFSYNPDTDALFQNALQGAMSAGQSAMQDTIGQASALTGGYGSSYATSAANQAYNAFIEDAYDNLPDYYNLALNAYNMESEHMLNQLNILNQADQTEWGRLSDAYNANAGYADTLYGREYQQWADSVSNAYNMAGMQNQDYWNQTDYDYQVSRDAVEDERWQKEWDFAQEQWEWQKAQASKSSGGGGGGSSSGGSGGSGDSSSGTNRYASGKAVTDANMSKYKLEALERMKEGGKASLSAYVDGLGLDTYTATEVASYAMYHQNEAIKQQNTIEKNANAKNNVGNMAIAYKYKDFLNF